MAKFANDLVLDALLDYLSSNATRLVLCSQEPTNFTEANVTYLLAQETLSGGDFTKADGDASGRKITVASKSGISVGTSGTGNHIALLDVSNSRLLIVTTCNEIVVDSAGTLTTSAFDLEVADPV